VTIDYEVVSQDDFGKGTYFVVAVKNEVVENYLKLFKSAGLLLESVESSSLSLRRIINYNVEGKKVVMSLDIGEEFSNIMVMDEGNIYFSRMVPLGGQALTRAISVNLGLDAVSSEEYKKNYGMDERLFEGKVKNAVLPVFSNLVDEIRRAMAMYNEERHKNIDLIVISGGGANMPGFASELNKNLSIEVQIIQPFLKIDVAQIAHMPVDINKEGSRFALAVGLGLRDMI
jgi:type IV pilus assembly protein PilM